MVKYDILLFDLVGVLVEGSHRTTQAILEATSMSDKELRGFWMTSPTVRDFDSGRISGREFGEKMVEDLNLPLDPAEFLELFGSWLAGLYDGTEALLSKLSASYRLGCFSNINEIMWPPIRDEHGLLNPDRVIEPYDLPLRSMNAAKRRIWAKGVLRSLLPRLSGSDEVVFLAGNAYRENLVSPIREQGCRVEIPMVGLRIGEQLNWLNEELRD